MNAAEERSTLCDRIASHAAVINCEARLLATVCSEPSQFVEGIRQNTQRLMADVERLAEVEQVIRISSQG